MPGFKRVRAGQPLTLSASDFNALMDLGREWQAARLTAKQTDRRPKEQYNPAFVLGMTGADTEIPASRVVKLQRAANMADDDEFQMAPVFYVTTANDNYEMDAIGITVEPIPKNGIGRVAISGLIPVFVNQDGEEPSEQEKICSQWARIETDGRITPDNAGELRLIMADETTGGDLDHALAVLPGTVERLSPLLVGEIQLTEATEEPDAEGLYWMPADQDQDAEVLAPLIAYGGRDLLQTLDGKIPLENLQIATACDYDAYNGSQTGWSQSPETKTQGNTTAATIDVLALFTGWDTDNESGKLLPKYQIAWADRLNPESVSFDSLPSEILFNENATEQGTAEDQIAALNERVGQIVQDLNVELANLYTRTNQLAAALKIATHAQR